MATETTESRLELRTLFTALFAIAVTVFSLYLLHHLTAEISFADVVADIRNTPVSNLLLAVCATIVSFMAIACYEVLSVRTVAPGRVSTATAAWTGIAGFAISDVAGFHILTGGALRYRIYSQKGLDFPLVSQIVFLSWMSLWLGMAFLIGVALVAQPGGVLFLDWMTDDLVRMIGMALLALIGLYFVWGASGKRTWTVRGLSMKIPGTGTSVLQLASGVVDISASAFTLYILLPADVAGSLSGFFVLYISAVILGAISHSPGGLGVFEATILAGLGVAGRSDVLGALVLYRVIYYLLPLIPVALTLLFLEILKGHRAIRKSLRDLSAASEPLAPPLSAGLTFVGGLVLLFSGSLPGGVLDEPFVKSVLGLPFVESSHLLASLAGVALLVVANALLRRREAAFKLAMVLLVAGAILSLGKGPDVEEAILLVAIAALLLPFRPAFYRKSGGSVLDITPSWLAVISITVAAAIWLGFFAYRHVEYSNELWWQFSWQDGAPRFLRASVAVVAVVFALGLHMMLNRRVVSLPEPDAIPDCVRSLVAESPNTDVTIALLGDKQFLVAEDESAFLMYGVTGGSYISMCDPVGDREAGSALAWRFREMADQQGYRTAFYSVGTDYLPVYLDMGLSVLKMGEVARVDLAEFSLEGPKQKDFRYARRRAAKDGFEFEIIPREAIPDVLDELRSVSDAWLAIKSGKEKQFAIANFNDDYMRCFNCGVVRLEGKIVAFANILEGAGKEEMSIDLMRYIPKTSNILMDFLFAELLLHAQAESYRWFNLGAAPLAGLTDHPLATRWNRIGTMIYRRGEDFYHFEGLRSYKEKFNPVWTPHYLACPGGLAAPRVLFDVTALIAGGHWNIAKR